MDLLYQKLLRYQHHWENYQTSLLEGLTPSGLRIKKRPAINSISDTFEEQWNFVLYDAEKKLVQLLLKESEHIISKIKIQIEIKISNDHIKTGSTKHKQLEEKHLKFRQQLEIDEERNGRNLKNVRGKKSMMESLKQRC